MSTDEQGSWGRSMRGRAVALAIAVLGSASAAGAQSEEEATTPRTAEQFIETAREVYAVDEPEPVSEPCATPTAAEIVVCGQRDKVPDQRLQSPTERADEAGEMPPDPIPSAPDLYGGMRGGVVVARGCFIAPCPPPYPPMVDFAKIPEPLTPEEAALVFRAEDLPSSAGASPAEAP